MKVGILGLGVMGRNHARVLSSMESVSEVCLFDPASVEGDSFLGHQIETDLQRTLDAGLDYCVVSAPTNTHQELALVLASRKIPTLVEKPIAPSVTEGRRILEAFTSAGVIGAVGHIERYNPAAIGLKAKIEEGILGEMYQITTRRVGPYTGRIRDVGVIKDLATHDIHLVTWLTGESYAHISARTTSPSDGAHEDSVLAIGNLTNGTLVSHVVNWISPTKERVTTVLGERGLLVADTLGGNLFFHENGTNQSNWDSLAQFKGISEGPVHKFELKSVEPLVLEHTAFQEAVTTKSTEGVVSFGEALVVLETAERMIEASKH
jgi:predicted dehydrogenase